jgi:hypothetical protein
MLLGACGLKKRILVLSVGLWACLAFLSCGGSSKKPSTSGLPRRVLASQGVTTTLTFGGLVIINGDYDTTAPVAPLSAGANPGLMAISPARNLVAAFDASSNSVYAVNTVKESTIGNLRIQGSTTSMVVPLSSPIVYVAVPSATVTGFVFQGAVDVLNFSGGNSTTIAVTNAQTVVSNATGTQLLVFSNDSDLVTVLSPGAAVPPVDQSCLSNPPNAVCTIVPGFSRPVFAVVSGSTAYILNCGLQCGGSAQTTSTVCGPTKPACVSVFDLGSLTITNTIPVDAATMALLSGTTLYVAGTPPTNNACTGQTTAATICGRLDVVNLGTNTVTGSAVITDGYHDRMDLTVNGQLFVGSYDCTNIGDANNPSGEVRGCLSIYHTADGSVLIPPDNGNVDGLQGFNSRFVEYVAEGGNLRVYDTTRDILLINDFITTGTIPIVGYVGDVKAIDFF